MLWSCIVRPTKPFVNDGFGNQFDAPDNASYQCLQMHGCIAVKNDELGYISVLLIGMAQISSVQLHNKPGDGSRRAMRSLTSDSAGLTSLLCFKLVRWCRVSGHQTRDILWAKFYGMPV